MNYDELAFTNQQLAGMLRSGIPLEGALKQLSSTMQQGLLRTELEQLQTELAKGTPLREALNRSDLPDFYIRMIQLGAQSNDLPGILTLLADYYQRKNLLWTRLKGLIVYPAIILFVSLVLSLFLTLSVHHLSNNVFQVLFIPWDEISRLNALILAPLLIVILLVAAFAVMVSVPRFRNGLRWRILGFREANLSNFAASLQLLLKQGATLDEALALLSQMEGETPLRVEILRWRKLLSTGHVKSADFAEGSKIVPPLFFWLISGDEENWINGLGRAAELYYRRATHKIETLLYAALPVSILLLGSMIIMQVIPLMRVLIRTMDMGFDGGVD